MTGDTQQPHGGWTLLCKGQQWERARVLWATVRSTRPELRVAKSRSQEPGAQLAQSQPKPTLCGKGPTIHSRLLKSGLMGLKLPPDPQGALLQMK